MKHKSVIVVEDTDIVNEVNGAYGTNIESIANLFFEGDFMNDCYKSLWIDEEADENRGYACEDEDNFKLRNLVRAHLRQCFPNTERIIVDVSW
jgi:hypothetical protein